MHAIKLYTTFIAAFGYTMPEFEEADVVLGVCTGDLLGSCVNFVGRAANYCTLPVTLVSSNCLLNTWGRQTLIHTVSGGHRDNAKASVFFKENGRLKDLAKLCFSEVGSAIGAKVIAFEHTRFHNALVK